MSSTAAQASLSRTAQTLNGSRQSRSHARAAPNEPTSGLTKPASKQYAPQPKRLSTTEPLVFIASSPDTAPASTASSKSRATEGPGIASAWTKRPAIASPTAKQKIINCTTSSVTPVFASIPTPALSSSSSSSSSAATLIVADSTQIVEEKVSAALIDPLKKMSVHTSSHSYGKRYSLKPAIAPDTADRFSVPSASHRRSQAALLSTSNGGNSNNNSTSDNNSNLRQSSAHRRHSESLQDNAGPVAPLPPADIVPSCFSHSNFVQPYYAAVDEDASLSFLQRPPPPPPILEDLMDLPPTMSAETYEHELEALLQSIRPSLNEQAQQEELFTALKDLIATRFASFTLHRFGSTVSGFSLKHADLDFCLFDPEYLANCHQAHNPERKLDAQVKIIVALGDILKKEKRFFNIKVLSRARIPIVKLKDMVTGISCDIGVNNALALHNTRLLATYAAIDPRVTQLALIVKYWAKRRGLNEPYWGTLSSYCYLMMIIYYLQRTEQPILPVLQALGRSDAAPEVVEGYDIYFYSDLGRLPSVWPHQGANRASLASLLSGFFRYFAYDFPYSSSVLSVRTGTLLSRYSKGWTLEANSLKAGCFWFCVEDPFELSHNLGRAVSRNRQVPFLAFLLSPAHPLSSLYYIRGHFIRASKLISRHASIYHICLDASLE